MAKSYFILILTLFIGAIPLKAQTISGHVYDETRTPLEGAVVYFDGTTLSVSTNSEGYFSIKGDKDLPAALIVSFISYKPVRINNPFTGNQLEIILMPDAILMDEAVVKGKTLFSRVEMLRAFKKQFLGESRAGASCKIENENDIRLRYDSANNILYAEAVRPLRIINERLKYIITFDLVASEVRYRIKTLSPNHIRGAFFGGTTFFTDISDDGNADKARRKAYLGSPMHFVKTVLSENWEEQKFQMFRGSFKIDPKKYFYTNDTLGMKKVTIADPETDFASEGKIRRAPGNPKIRRFEVLYNKKVQSFLLYNEGIFYANTNGLFWPLQELTFGGYMGNLRVGDMLPADYKLEK